MARTSTWGTTPRLSIEAECVRRGRRELVAGCRALVRGDDADPALLMALAGPAAAPFLDGTSRPDDYWLRVWGARGLLWVWDDAATGEIRDALTDDSWRVREMSAKVAARHRLGAVLAEVDALQRDDNARVRRAAERAVAAITAAGT